MAALDVTVDVVVVVVVVTVLDPVVETPKPKLPVPNEEKMSNVCLVLSLFNALSREAALGASQRWLAVLYHGLLTSLHLFSQESEFLFH